MKFTTFVRSSAIAALALLVPALASHAAERDGKTITDPNALDSRGVMTLNSLPTGPTAASGYTFAQSVGTYAPISGGTVLATSCDDNNYNANAIPFTFNYNGTDYTQFSVNCNGFLAMGAAVTSSYAPLSTGVTNNVIVAMGMDQQTNAASSDLSFDTLGTAPNRVLVVQWNNFRNWNTTGDSYNYQIRLHETSNVIEVAYGAFTKNATSRTPQVGLRGASNADFNNRTGTGAWQASTAGGTNAATRTLNQANLPDPGLTWTWTPPNFPPVVSFAPLANTTSTANRTLAGVSVVDADGVNSTAGTAPRVYFKRASDANAWNDNTSGTDGWKYAEGTANGPAFDFTIDYSLLNGGTGVSTGDQVQYFVVAQDLAATPLVGIFPGSFAATPASVNLDASAFPIGGTPASYAIVPVLAGGTYAVPGDYPSLTNAGGAFEAINNSVLAGSITLEIAADLTTETGAVALNQFAETGAGGYTLLIKPVGAARVISGSSATGLITLNGADRVTIDGSLSGGTDQSLTVTNTSTAGTVFWLRSASVGNGATNNTIENCLISGAGATVGGILASGTVLGGDAEAANSDNTIRNNVITKVQNALYLRGGASAGTFDQNWLVTGNILGSTVTADKLSFRGMLIGNAANFTISNNTVQGVVSTSTSTAAMNGIQVALGIAGGTITGNTINNIEQTNPAGYPAYGLYLGSGSAASGVTIANNMIADIASYSDTSTAFSYQPVGIMLTGTNGGWNLYYNSVNLSGSHTGLTGATMQTALFVGATVTAVDLRNNIFSNSYDNSSSSTDKSYAVYSAAPASSFTNIDHNDYFVSGATGVLGNFGGSDVTTLGDWQTATGQDAASISGDPLFVSDTDLHLTAASAAIGGATPLAAVTTDFDGGIRDATAPDMGADEFGVIAPVLHTVTGSVGTPSGSISPSGAQSVVDGSTITFTATADAGHHFVDFTGTCPGLPSVANPVTTGAITADCSITANFAVDAAPAGVRISQVYGGGGGTGYYLHDYVELFNPGTSAVNLAGHSLQYGSATGQFGSSPTNIYAFPAGTSIAAGKYLLVQLSTPGTSGLALPAMPDLTTTNLTMSGTNGKVALANVAAALGCGATATPCALPHANIVDLAAWGTANNAEGGVSINNGAALTAQQGGVRKLAGCQDTDNNHADFDVLSGASLLPRNASSPANTCGAPPVTHTVTSSVGTPSGAIAPLGAQTVNDGNTISFTLTADPGYEIDNVGGTCVGTLASGTFTTAAITADCTVIANFKVAPTDPVASITPAALSISATFGGSSASAPLTVANTGGGSLTYAVTESLPRPTPVAATPAELAQRGARSGAGSTGGVAPRANPAPLAVVADEGFDDITTLAGAGWLMGNHSQPVGSTGWFQGNDGVFAAFDGATTAYIGANFNNTAGAGIISNWLVTPEITFNPGSTGSFYTRTVDAAPFADRLEVRLCTSGDCTNFGTGAADVGNFTTVLLTINPTLQTGADPTGANGYPDVWTQFTLSGLPTSGTGRIAFRYFVANGGPSGANSNYIGIDRVVIDNGTPVPTGCTNPSDIPWLSASPLSGAVAGGASDTVTVTANPTGLAVGTHSANVCVATNDPAAAMTSVPVTLTIAAGATHTVTPSVTAGLGTITPNTPQSVAAGTTTAFTLAPAAGYQVGSVGGTCGGTLVGSVYTTAPVTADCTVEVTFTVLPFPAPYCNVTFPSAVEPISRVAFTGIDNPSDPTVGASPALEDFLSVTGGAVSLGGVYDIAVEGNSDGPYTNKVRVYVDWNQNNSFADAGEVYNLSDLVNSTGADGQQATGVITVPATAALGATRMRVIKRYSTAADPCNTTGFGQAEDYTITVDNNPLPLPEAQVSPLSLSLTAQVGTSDTDTLTVSNVGPGRLTFNITRALPMQGLPDPMRGVSPTRITPRSLAVRAEKLASLPPSASDDLIGAYARDGGEPEVVNAVLANDPMCEVGTPGLVVHDGNAAPDNGYGWNASAGTNARIVDKFTPAAYPASYSTVCVTLLTNAGLTSAPVQVVVYADDGAAGAPGTELGRVSATANNIGAALLQSFQAIDITSMGLNIASGSVYIGLEWDATALSGLFLASDETSAANAGGYFYASGAWNPIIDDNVDYKSMFIRAIEVTTGTPGSGCGSPTAVSWLSAAPLSGVLNGPGSVAVTVTANAAGMMPGTYSALVCVNTNDPGSPRFDIPVTFVVTPLPPAIFSDGFEGDDPVVDPNIVTGTINQPVVNNADGNTFDFVTLQWGVYNAGRVDDVNLYNAGSGIVPYWYGDVVSGSGGVDDGTGQYAILQSGAVIGPASTFILSGQLPMNNWLSGADGYLGVKFWNETTSQFNYGYIHITTSSPDGYPAQVLEFGYNKAGNPITIP